MAIISPIFKILSQSQRNLSSNRDQLRNINRTLFNRQKFKRDYYAQTNFLRRRRDEDERRQQLEDELEAPRVITKGDGASQLAQKSTSRGWFERIIGFIGYLSAGWIMNNLPTWIGMGKEFIARLKKAGEIASGFFNDTIKLFTNFGNLLSAAGQNLLKFDFFDTSNRIKNALGELNSTVGDMGSKLEEALGLVTTPLTEGKYSGQEIPGLGTQQTDEGAYGEPPPYTSDVGPETSGGKVSPQAVYAYLRSKNISHIHAMGILANIEGESGFEIGVQEKGDSQQGIGLFQYTYPSRKQAFLKYVPDYKTNWKGQIDFAIDRDPNTPIYLRKQFASPEAAADDWMIYWENPHSRVYAQRRRKHNDFIRSFKPGTSQQPQQTGQRLNQSSLPPLPPTNTLGGGVQRYGASRPGGRRHAGTDFDISGNQKFYSRIGGIVTKIGYDPGGYGKYIDIYNSQLGTYERIAEAAFVLVKKDQIVQPGQAVVQGEGPTGVIHYEIRKNSGYGFSGTLDPIEFLKKSSIYPTQQSSASLPLLQSQSQAQPSPQIPAQISPPSQQTQIVPFSITPERRGPDIIIAQPRNQQQTIVTSSGGQLQQGSPITNFDLLNNFIKNKLLLDLAYL